MPSKDNTLYEYDPAEGDHSNGAGFHLFAGKNGEGEVRRGRARVRYRGKIPAGSTITGVILSMNMSMTPTGAVTVELHKLLADWGEGTSHAPMGKVTERRLLPTMPHGDTVFSIASFGHARRRFFGHDKCEPVGRRSLDITRGVPHRWLRMCNRGWTTPPVTLAGWCWATRPPSPRQSGLIHARAPVRLS